MKDRGAADKSTHVKRQTACAERGSRRGAAQVSECAVAGPGDNIRRTVTVVERYRKQVKAFFAAMSSSPPEGAQGGYFL